MTSTSGSAQFILNSVENKKDTISKRLKLKPVNLLFPTLDDLEKNEFTFGTQVNYISSNTSAISNNSVLRFVLTNSFKAISNIFLELVIPGGGSPVFPTSNFHTGFNFIQNLRVTVGSNVIMDQVDGQSLLMYIAFMNNAGDIQTMYPLTQLTNISGTLSANYRILIPLPILSCQQVYYPGIGKWSFSYHSKAFQVWPMTNDNITIEVTMNGPSYVISSGSFTNNSFVSANLRFKSYEFDTKYLPSYPYVAFNPTINFSYQSVSLTTSLQQFDISSIIKSGEIQALLVAFTSTTNYTALDYNNFTKQYITRLQLLCRNLTIVDIDNTRSSNYIDDTIQELETCGKNLELLSYRTTGNNTTGPFYVLPINNLNLTVSQLGSNGMNITGENYFKLNIQASQSVTYNMKVIGIYKSYNYINDKGLTNYDM